jgi:ketosteroid isomerase-like protein
MKKMRIILITAVLAAGLLMLAGCASTGAAAPTSQDDFTAMVKATWVQYSGSLVAGDANRWMSLWDVNGVQLPPDSPMVMSTEDLRAGITGTLAAVSFKSMDIKLTKAWVDHELGWATGNYSYTFVTADGKTTVSYDGKYQTIFRRQTDGSWKIFRDCFNSNVP